MTESLMTPRELSWLEFNARVLEEARDPSVPLLERVKFLSIFSSNLDEFFMVRYASLCRQITAGVPLTSEGLAPQRVLEQVSRRAHELVALQHYVLGELLPLLAQHRIVLRRPAELSLEQRIFVEDTFRRTVLPVLTPVAVDPGHPFPYLPNRGLCLIAELDAPPQDPIPTPEQCLIPIPTTAARRFLRLPAAADRYEFMLLEDVVRMYLPVLFPGAQVRSSHTVRVTRDAELDLQEDQSEDLLSSIEEAVRKRRLGVPMRLQYEAGLPDHLLALLSKELELDLHDLYPTQGFTALTDLFQLYSILDIPSLKEAPFHAEPVPAFEDADDPFAAIRAGDLLLYHPYDDFKYVSAFILAAAQDPQVLAIKMTLYRVSANSAIANALTIAARHGKQVTVLVELRARFNEEDNIGWARLLESEGANVVYGIVNLKTHCKAALVVRKEADGIRRYCHLSTGNYNDQTAKFYTDYGLFTCDDAIGEDLTHLFNLLTGYARPPVLRRLMVAPLTMREQIVSRIHREITHARLGRPAHLIAKLNALTDTDMIRELYAASQAGVRIELIIRGICCLRPGVPGLSENIQVYSIIDRFLEHARVYWFHNDGDEEFWLASADWMHRNLNRRIETAFPILDPRLRAQVWKLLQVQLADNVKARVLLADSSSVRRVIGHEPIRSQVRMMTGRAT